MESYSAQHIFTVEHLALMHAVQGTVDQFIEPEPGFFRCHEIARAIHELFNHPGIVTDGVYAGVEHSWIHLYPAMTILDVYAVGRAPMVQLVDLGRPTLQRSLFTPGEPRFDIRYDVVRGLIAQAQTWPVSPLRFFDILRQEMSKGSYGLIKLSESRHMLPPIPAPPEPSAAMVAAARRLRERLGREPSEAEIGIEANLTLLLPDQKGPWEA